MKVQRLAARGQPLRSWPCQLCGRRRPQMNVADIRPGMVGVGRTVFDGTQVEEFRAHILGVIENVIGTAAQPHPRRLEGGPLANTGVIAGMSGSPVYIDGQLIGAVSYALGSFSKEPIAGITPIAEMTDATALATARPAGRARAASSSRSRRDGLVASFRKALNWNRPFADRPGRCAVRRRRPASPASAARDRHDAAADRDAARHVRIRAGRGRSRWRRPSAIRDSCRWRGARGTRAGEMPFDGPLKPGDAIGVTFVSGDLELGATGTVTHIDGDRVYAFGHPMYNLGPTEFPMTRAYVYTVLPSLFSSAKLSSTGEVIGTFTQDRATAIAGRLGPGPKLLPVTMTLEADRGGKRTFKFNVVRDQLFTPLMTYTALVNTLGVLRAAVRHRHATAVQRKAAAEESRRRSRSTIMFAGDNVASNASAYVVAPMTALINNDYENVDIERLELTVKSTEEPSTATLERVWIDDPRPRAGRTVPLKVLLRTYRGEDIIRTIPIDDSRQRRAAPSSLMVSRRSAAQPGRAARGAPAAAAQRPATRARAQQGPPQQHALREAARLRCRRGRQRRTAVVAAALGARGARIRPQRRQLQPARSATLGEWELPTDHAISGVRTLTIQLSRELTHVVRHLQRHYYGSLSPFGAADACRRRSPRLRGQSAHRARRRSSSRPPPRPTS